MFDFPMLQGLGQLTQQPQVQAPPRMNMPLLNIPMLGGTPEPEDNITSLMNQLYNPQMGMQNQYNELIQNYPQREQPSGWRRFGAALYGMGREDPLKAADQFNNYHYYQNLSDWNNQAKNLQMAADNERAQNINERQIAYQTAGRTLEERRIKETERKNLETEDLKRKTEDRRAQSARILDHIRMNPNFVPREINGELVFFDPRTGDTQSTGFKGLSDQERLDIQNAAAMARTKYSADSATERTGMTIAGQADRQQVGAWNVVEVDDPNNPGKKKTVRMNTITGAISDLPVTGARRIGTGAGSGGDPNLAESRARYVRAQEAKMKPGWSKYVTLGPNNTVTIQPPGIFSGPDAKTHKEISDFILGTTMPANMAAPGRTSGPLKVNPPGASNTTAPTIRRQRNNRTGEVRVSYDGGKTWSNQ